MDDPEVTEGAALPEDVSGDAGETSPPAEPLPLEMALSWLAAARPAAVLALLRDPEFAYISMNAFVGFRVNAGGYANPLVRRRLALEIVQNDAFAEKLRALAEDVPVPAEKPALHVQPVMPSAVPERPSREEELKAERDRRRQERDEARQALREAQDARVEADSARRRSDEERDAQTRLAEQQAQRIARLERQVSKLKAEHDQLLKALRQDKVSARPRSSSRGTPPPVPHPQNTEPDGVWPEAVRHLLNKGKPDLALALAQDVLRDASEDASALDIAAHAYERKGEPREAAEMTRRLLAVRLARGETAASAEVLVRLLLLLPPPPDARREARQWLSYLKADDGAAIGAGRRALDRLRGLSPAAWDWLAAEVANVAPALADELMPAPGALGPDDPLPLPGAWTARRLGNAVNAGDEGAVREARESLTALQQTNPDTYERVWAALERVAEADDSLLLPLRRIPRSPVVVDGSNAAWFDQHSLSQPRARLAPILALRRALRRRSFFPVILYADAPLPYTIDDPDTLRAMLGRGEIMLVDGGVDADEVLVREAKRREAPLVTNDYMNDWDPQGEVEKIQYTISLTGEAHLLS